MGFGGVGGFGDGDPDDEHEDFASDDDDRDRPRSAIPDPLDRLWLHPSELSPPTPPPAPVARTRPMWTTTLVAGAAGAILTLAVLGAMGALGGSSGKDRRAAVPTSVPIVTAQALAIAVAHSVVAVTAHGNDGTRRGSGVCVHRSGEILTSDRLVGSGTSIQVTTADGVVHAARVVGRDTTTDLVLLTLTSDAPGATTPASTSKLGVPAPSAAQEPSPGDTMWVVGAPSPGDSSLWMSSGVLASDDSKVAIPDGPTTSGLLETAAASGSGASGGALVDRTGDVTGIVLSPIGDDRVTYAVPITTALSIAADLRDQGYTTHGALGINGVSAPTGATVTEVVAGGPAEQAGVHVNDVIEAVGHHDIDTMNDLMALVRHYDPGKTVTLDLKRGDRTLQVTATLGSLVTK